MILSSLKYIIALILTKNILYAFDTEIPLSMKINLKTRIHLCIINVQKI